MVLNNGKEVAVHYYFSGQSFWRLLVVGSRFSKANKDAVSGGYSFVKDISQFYQWTVCKKIEWPEVKKLLKNCNQRDRILVKNPDTLCLLSKSHLESVY